MGFEYKLKNAYIWWSQPLVLQKVLDFTTSSRGDFTYVNTQAWWLTINTSWWYVTQSEAQTTTWAWMVGKEINATRFWWRIKFMNIQGLHGAVWVWTFYNNATLPDWWQLWHFYPDSSFTWIGIATENVDRATASVSCSINTYYYLDLKFDNGLYTCILYDANLNPLKTTTYQSSDSIMKYSWFLIRWWSNNRANWRVYEYREAYDNN